MSNCRDCGVELIVGENWWPSHAKQGSCSCIECRKAYDHQWRQGQSRDRADYWPQHYAANRERECARSRQYYSEHQEERVEYTRQWKQENPEKNRDLGHRYRARKANVTIGEVDIAAICDRDKVCIYCGSAEDLTIDHLTPLARGGPHQQDNLAVACRRCNSRKSTKTYEEFKEASDGQESTGAMSGSSTDGGGDNQEREVCGRVS